MRKKIIIGLLVLIFFISAAVSYVNIVVLPVKVKSLVVENLKGILHKDVALESLSFSIFKGLVLKNIMVSDKGSIMLKVSEGSCSFRIFPLLKKKLVIAHLKLRTPELFLERYSDNTFSAQDLVMVPALAAVTAAPSVKLELPGISVTFKKTTPVTPKAKARQGFSVSVDRVTVARGIIHFKDNNFSPVFSKNIEKLNLDIRLSLPQSAKLKLQAEIPAANMPLAIKCQGDINIPKLQVNAALSLENISLKEFAAYYRNTGLSIPQGLINILAKAELKDSLLNIAVDAKERNLSVGKDGVTFFLNSDISANVKYGLLDRRLQYSGKAILFDSGIDGLHMANKLEAINGEVNFSDSGLNAQNLSAKAWGLPLKAKVNIPDFSKPVLSVNILSSLSLVGLPALLKDKFQFVFPGSMEGSGTMGVDIQSPLPIPESGASFTGYLNVVNGKLKLDKMAMPVEEINGKLEFSPDKLGWKGLVFKYSALPYKSSGSLADFKSPQVQLELASKEFYLDSVFAVNKDLITLSRCKGRYGKSEFSVSGILSSVGTKNLGADIKGELKLELGDLGSRFDKVKKPLEQVKASGALEAQFVFSGNPADFKTSSLQAKLASQSLSLLGLKADQFNMDYSQENGIVDILSLHMSLYDGTLDASARLNLDSKNMPYRVSAQLRGIKIEKLKNDTAARERDIAGMLSADISLNGLSSDISKLTGLGKISVTGGKLWQLNLFKGLGSILFTSDFADIKLQEASCSFSVGDKNIYSNDVKITSPITELEGSARIGFDSSLEAELNVHVVEQMVPASGTFRDVTTAILGQTAKFGTIKISGTIKEPKFKFKTAVGDIIKGIKDAVLGN